MLRLDHLTLISLRHPALTILFSLALAVAFAYGMGQTQIENGFRSYLGDDSPELAKLTQFIEQFGGGVPLVAVYDCDSGDSCETVFDPAPLAMAHRIFVQLSALEGVSEVHTPADTPLLVAIPPDDFESRQLYGDPQIDHLAALASQDPLWDRFLVSESGNVGAIVVQFETPDPILQRQATLLLRSISSDYSAQGFTFRFIGESVDFTLGTEALRAEQDRIMPWLILTMCMTIAALFRSYWAALIALIAMTFATAAAQGSMGLLAVPIDATTQNVLSVVLVVGICDSIHFLSRYALLDLPTTAPFSAARIDHLLLVSSEIAKPCLWTTITTVVAFLSFVSSDFHSFRYFGLFCAFGVAFALLVTFTLVPLLLSWLPAGAIRSRPSSRGWNLLADSLIDLASRRHRAVLASFTAFLVAASYGAAHLKLHTSIAALMGASNPLIEWSDWVEDHMRSPESIELELQIPSPDTILDPGAFSVVENVESYLQSAFVELGPVRSILDPMRRIDYFLNGQGEVEAARFSQDRLRIADSLALIDQATSDRWLSVDKRHVRLSVEAASMNTAQQRVILDSLDNFLSTELPAGWQFSLTGSVPIFGAMMERLLSTQASALAAAGIGVLICLALLLRFDPGLIALSILPNVMPVIAVLGFVGLAGISLDVGIVIVGPMIIGISVDDTIHMVGEHKQGLRGGLSPAKALDRAIRLVQRPIVTSSGALCVGFLTLSVVSRYGVIQTFGVVVCLAVLAALAADLLLVPALIHRFSRMIPDESPPSRKR